MKRPNYDESWSPEVKALYRHDMQEIWDPAINKSIWNQYHNQLNEYLSFSLEVSKGRSIDILDVGCAQGTLAMLLAERGHRVIANDLRPAFLDYAKSRYVDGDIEFIAGNVLDVEFSRKFDLIFANQIIEHLVYPDQLVGRLRSMLRPGGWLVVTTPNWHYIKNNLPSFVEIGDPAQYEDRQFTADADGHFFAYTGQELRSVFERQGLAAIRVSFFETPMISGHMKVRYLHSILPRWLLIAMDRVMLSMPFGRALSHQLMVVGRG